MRFFCAIRPGSTTPVTPPALRRGLAPVLCSLLLGALLLVGCAPMPEDITESTPPTATVVASVDCERCVSKAPSPSTPGTGSPAAAGLQEGVAFLASREILPSLWLVNAEGGSANVVWPLDVCGMSKPEVAEALKGLPLSETKMLTVKGPSQ